LTEVRRSLSDDVHVGEDGWLFLVRGSNEVIDLYRDDSSFTDTMARAWVELLRERQDMLNARGIEYVHLAAPEKLTLLHRFYGQAADGKGLENLAGSPIMQLVDRYDWDTPSLLNVVPYLSGQIDNYPVYWKSDTHWSCWGAFLAYQLLCSRLKIPVNEDLLNYPYVEGDLVMDLGGKTEPAIPEKARFYQLDRDSRRVYANPLVRYKEANGMVDEGSLHVGSHVIYRNDSPKAADKTIVLFGDSFSECRNHLLSGMLAETVRELHFIWNASIDHEYVRRIRPDIVITELAERFMTRIPVDDLDIVSLGRERVANHRASLAKGDKTSDKTSDKGGEGAAPSAGTSHIVRTPVLESECYDLHPPGTVQPACDPALVDAQACSRPVTVVQAHDARLYFSGVRCLVTLPGGETIRRYAVDRERQDRVADEEYRRLRGTTMLLADTAGAYAYYHWLMDVLPKFAMLERAGISLDTIDHFVVREITHDFQRETLARFGIGPDRIVESLRDQYLHAARLVHVELDNGGNLKMHRSLPAWLKHEFPHRRSDEPRMKLYISRPEGVRRGVANEAELLPILQEHGFTVMPMEGLDVQQQIQLMARVDVLVSPHGGALTNMVFCRTGTRVLELLGRHVYPFYFGLAAACGHRYHAVLQEPAEDFGRLVGVEASQRFAAADVQQTTAWNSFEVDVDTFRAALERL